jgi:DNA-binding NtrC family response regulator
LAVFPIRIPPLRERHQDILPLAEHFLARYGRTMGRQGLKLSAQSNQALQSYPWPGNVRELENAMQRALLLSDGDLIEPNDIELHGSEPSMASSAPMANLSAGGTPLAYSSDTESRWQPERSCQHFGTVRKGPALQAQGLQRSRFSF